MPMDDAAKQQLLEENSDNLGRKIGFLIAAISPDSAVEEALVALVEKMDDTQIERFAAILETQYLQHATASEDQELAATLTRVSAEHDQAVATAQATALANLNDLARTVPANPTA